MSNLKATSKKGQVTIFVIVAVLIVAVIAIFFLFKLGVVPTSGSNAEENPEQFLASCIEGGLREKISTILSQGGYISNPLNKSFKFSEEKEATDIAYLCYTQNDYLPCINQEALLIQHLKKEIRGGIKKQVRDCFTDLTKSLSKKGYVVDATYKDFEVDLISKKIILKIDAKISLTKKENSIKREKFNLVFNSRFYDLAIVVQEIVSQEARFCNFEQLGFMLFYPEYEIKKFRAGEDIIYRVKHRKTQEEFKFIIRGCVIPAGG